MKKFSAVLALAAVILAVPAGATEWIPMGPRALGMGGAGVALTQGPVASYWNPAALGRPTENAYGFQIPVTIHAALTGDVVEGANDLKNVKDCGSGCTQADADKALAELDQPGNGLRVNVGAGGDFKIGRAAFFANGFADVGAVPSVDGSPADSSLAAIQAGNNKSALILKGARIIEFGGGYGHELPFAPGLFLGGNLKLMQAQVGYANFQVLSNNNGNDDVLKQFKNGAAKSSAFGVDAGLLWDVQRTYENAPLHPRFGLVGRNLNDPKFSQPAAAAANGVTGKYAENGQVRMGASISPFHWWNVAMDMDLTRNLTPVDNVASRQLGLGTEFNVFNRTWINIPLRFGFSRNLEDAGAGNSLTAGFGLNFLHFMLDVSGSASHKSISTQSQGKSQKIPTELAAAIQIGILFGGSEDDGRATPHIDSNQAEPVSTQQVEKVRQDADKAQKELDKAAHEGEKAPDVKKPVEPSSDPHTP